MRKYQEVVMKKSIVLFAAVLCAVSGLSYGGDAAPTEVVLGDIGPQTMQSKFYASDAARIEVTRSLSLDRRLIESVCRSGPMLEPKCEQTNRILAEAEYNCVRRVFRLPAPNFPQTGMHTIKATDSLREFSALPCRDTPLG